MKVLFQDILGINDVQGVVFISFEGKSVFQEFKSPLLDNIPQKNWALLIESLQDALEVEVAFENSMLYIIKVESGFLLVFMSKTTPMAMVRLNCSIILPELSRKGNQRKGIGRFFRKKHS
jgi:hypothetical protein